MPLASEIYKTFGITLMTDDEREEINKKINDAIIDLSWARSRLQGQVKLEEANILTKILVELENVLKRVWNEEN